MARGSRKEGGLRNIGPIGSSSLGGDRVAFTRGEPGGSCDGGGVECGVEDGWC